MCWQYYISVNDKKSIEIRAVWRVAGAGLRLVTCGVPAEKMVRNRESPHVLTTLWQRQ
jgi:hypothetical protein